MILLTGRVKVPVPAPRHVRVRAPVDSDAGQVLPAVLPFDLGRVAKPPRVEARVPVVWQYATPAVVPDCRVAAVVPVLPIVLARRPPTRNRLIASGSANVSGAAAIHASLAVPYAEQSILVSQSAAIGVSQPAGNTVGVAGSADVRARYTVAATNSIGVSGVASDRVRHTVSASQTVQVSGTGSGVRATYGLAASQTITTSGVGDVRPTVPLSATQDVSASGAASTVPSVGSVNADASNDCEVTGSADVRARYTVDAVNSVSAGGSASRDGITIPLAATQAIAVSETADVRARYTLAATQSVAVSESGVVTPSVAAAQAVATACSADARARYTLAAAGSAAMSQSATVAARYFSQQRMNKSGTDGWNGNQVTGWVSDTTYPATISSSKLVVQGTKQGATINLVAVVSSSTNNNGWIQVYCNNVAVGTQQTFPSTQSTRSLSFTMDVNAGDLLEMRANSSYNGHVYAGTYLEVL